MSSITNDPSAFFDSLETGDSSPEKRGNSYNALISGELQKEPDHAPATVKDNPAAFFDGLEQESKAADAPKDPAAPSAFDQKLIESKGTPLDSETKKWLDMEDDPEQLKRIKEQSPWVPLSDEQHRTLYDNMRGVSKQPEGAWDTARHLTPIGFAYDAAKEAFPLILQTLGTIGLATAKIGNDLNLTDPGFQPIRQVAPNPAALKDVKDLMSAYPEMGRDVLRTKREIAAGGTDATDRFAETIGIHNYDDSFKNYLARERLKEHDASYDANNPSIWGQFANYATYRPALAAIARYAGPDKESIKHEFAGQISDDQARAIQDKRANDAAEQAVQDVVRKENENPEDPGLRTLGSFFLPSGNLFSVGGHAIGAAGSGYSALKALGRTSEELNAEIKASMAAKAANPIGPLGKAMQAVGAAGGAVDRFGQKINQGAEKVLSYIPGPARPLVERHLPLAGIGAGAGFYNAMEDPGDWKHKGLSFLETFGGIEGAARIPRALEDIGKGVELGAGGETGAFKAAAINPESAQFTRAALRIAGVGNPAVLDWLGNNAKDYAKTGVQMLPLAVAMGVAQSADPHEMGQILSNGLIYGGLGQFLHKAVASDPITNQRIRSQKMADIQKTLSGMYPESQANIAHSMSWDNVIDASANRLNEAHKGYVDAIQKSPQGSPEVNEAAQELANASRIHEMNQRANPQTRQEYAVQAAQSVADGAQRVNGPLRAGKNVRIEALTTDQIAQKLMEANTGKIAPEEAQQAAQTGAGAFFSRHSDSRLIDPFKDTVVVNMDHVLTRQQMGEDFNNAFHHELGHALEAIPEWRDINEGVRETLFGTEHRDANGNFIGGTPGVYSQEKLVNAFNDTYAKGLKNGVTPQQFAERLGLWKKDPNRPNDPGHLDEVATAKYMQEELLADMNSHGISSNSGRGANPLLDWAITKQANNLVARGVHKVLGLGGEDAWTSPETGLTVSPEIMAAKRSAVRALKKLNGELSSSIPLKGQVNEFAKKLGLKEREGDTISRSEIMGSKALLEHYDKDSGLYKTEMQAIVTDADGKQVGTPIKIANPLAQEGTWKHETDDNGNPKITQTRGYGQIPDEVQGLTIPTGGQVHVENQFVYEADGVTPVANKPSDVKALFKTRAQLIRAALDGTPDIGYPGRMKAVSADGLTYRGTLTPLQIKAIQSLPESIVPYSIKAKLMALNEAIAKNDGSRFIGDYSPHVDKTGRYVPFAPKHVDFAPMGIHFSKDGHFLVTSISVSRLFNKLNLWGEKMPARLSLWDGSKEKFFNELTTKFLKNWSEGNHGELNLDEDPRISKQKGDIFKDFVNIAPDSLNPDPTVLPKKKGRLTKAERLEENSSDPNTLIRSFRLDAFADLIPHAGPKIPIDYEKAKINWMPARDTDEEDNDFRVLHADSSIHGSQYRYIVSSGEPWAVRIANHKTYKKGGFWRVGEKAIKDATGKEYPFEIEWEIPNPESVTDEDVRKVISAIANSDPEEGDFFQVVGDAKNPALMEFNGKGWKTTPLLNGSDIHYSPAKKEYQTSEEGLYSNLQKTIDEKVQGKFASPDQLKALINNPQSGIKPEEIKWTGVNDAIDRIASENGGKAPKDAVMEYLRNEGAVKLQPVTKKDTYHLEIPNGYDVRKEGEFSSRQEARDYAQANYIESYGVEPDEGGTKYKDYSLPSGTNYQEKVLTMPQKIEGALKEIMDDLYPGKKHNDLTPAERRWVDAYVKNESGVSENYTSSHFSDIPNYIAHIRESDHIVDGEPGRVIEEAQSDLHQSGRKEGYKGDLNGQELQAIDRGGYFEVQTRDGKFIANTANEPQITTPEQATEWAERRLTEEPHRTGAARQVADAPFRKDWPTQLLKRSLIDAVKDGKKWLGWVGGEEQANRYDLSKQVDSVDVEVTAPDNYRLTAYRGGDQVIDGGYSAQELPDVVGKDLAKKIIEDHGGTYSGLDLKVGGEGMTGFYDQILPAEAKKFLKKIDRQVMLEQIEIPKENGEGFGFGGKPKKGDVPMVKIWKFDITPEIERVVKGQGLPQFSPARELDGEHAKAVKAGDMETAQRLVDDAAQRAGFTIKAHHGTAREDRVGTRFRKSRATSGPMAFFTNDREVAEKYATGKQDTSIEWPEDYRDWFKIPVPGSKKETNVRDAWYQLSPENKADVTSKYFTTGYTDSDSFEGPIIPNSTGSIAGKDTLEYNLREARGNALEAAKELWLNSGHLFNREPEFLDVLKAMGIESAHLDDPNAKQSKVYDTYLKITKPLVTTEIPQEVLGALHREAKNQRAPRVTYGADAWDKRTRDAKEWMAQLDEDYAKGENSMVWTSIPDWVTKTLKRFGYDGIHDTGGKTGGKGNDVYVPFEEHQIKSSDPVTYYPSGKPIPLSQRFNEAKNDIRFAPAKDQVNSKMSPANEAIERALKVLEEMKREKQDIVPRGTIPSKQENKNQTPEQALSLIRGSKYSMSTRGMDERSSQEKALQRLPEVSDEIKDLMKSQQASTLGGQEHLVMHDGESGEWIKATRPTLYGSSIKDTPEQYLSNIKNIDALSGGRIGARVIGKITNDGNNPPSIVTKSNHVPGRHPKSQEELDNYLRDAGFTEFRSGKITALPPSWISPDKKYALFDIHVGNVKLTKDAKTGTIEPVIIDGWVVPNDYE